MSEKELETLREAVYAIEGFYEVLIRSSESVNTDDVGHVLRPVCNQLWDLYQTLEKRYDGGPEGRCPMTATLIPDDNKTIPFTRDDLGKLERTYVFLGGLCDLLSHLRNQDGDIHAGSLDAIVEPGAEDFEMFYKKIRSRFEQGGER